MSEQIFESMKPFDLKKEIPVATPASTETVVKIVTYQRRVGRIRKFVLRELSTLNELEGTVFGVFPDTKSANIFRDVLFKSAKDLGWISKREGLKRRKTLITTRFEEVENGVIVYCVRLPDNKSVIDQWLSKQPKSE